MKNNYNKKNDYQNYLQNLFLETTKEVFKEKGLDTSCFENKDFCKSLKSCVSGFEIKIG